MRKASCACAALRVAVARSFDPDPHLRGDTPKDAAGPDQLKGRELPPRVITGDNSAGNEVAGHGGGVQAVAAEAARHPHARTEFADLRHAMHRVAQSASPRIVDRDLAQLWKGFLDVGRERFNVVAGIALPYRCAARPHQPVTADNAIVIVGKISIADTAAIPDHI